MKTLADLKRAIDKGVHIEMVILEERPLLWSEEKQRNEWSGEWQVRPIAEKLQGVRYVSHKDTTGFYLKKPEDYTLRGSFCGWPKASHLEYDGDTFTITETDQHGDGWQKRTYKIIKYR